MREWLGRGSQLRIRCRRDLILAALAERDVLMTTQEIVASINAHAKWEGRRWTGVIYGQVYQDLRQLCGSHTLTYRECVNEVSVEGYPVVWHTWDTQAAGRTVWTLNPEYRAEIKSETEMLERMVTI